MVKMRCSDGVHNSAHSTVLVARGARTNAIRELKNGRFVTYHIRCFDTYFSQNSNNFLQRMILHERN